MERIARVVVPDFPHHLVQRGVGRMDVFFSAEDRKEYLHLRTGRPLDAADFVDRLEQFVANTLRPKKGGWPKGKTRS